MKKPQRVQPMGAKAVRGSDAARRQAALLRGEAGRGVATAGRPVHNITTDQRTPEGLRPDYFETEMSGRGRQRNLALAPW